MAKIKVESDLSQSREEFQRFASDLQNIFSRMSNGNKIKLPIDDPKETLRAYNIAAQQTKSPQEIQNEIRKINSTIKQKDADYNKIVNDPSLSADKRNQLLKQNLSSYDAASGDKAKLREELNVARQFQDAGKSIKTAFETYSEKEKEKFAELSKMSDKGLVKAISELQQKREQAYIEGKNTGGIDQELAMARGVQAERHSERREKENNNDSLKTLLSTELLKQIMTQIAGGVGKGTATTVNGVFSGIQMGQMAAEQLRPVTGFLTSLLSLIPVIGEGAEKVANAGVNIGLKAAGAVAGYGLASIGPGQEYESSYLALNRLSGRDRSYGRGIGQELGEDDTEFTKRMENIARNSGSGRNIDNRALGSLQVEKAFGVETTGLDRFYKSEGGSSSMAVVKLANKLDRSGIINLDPKNFDTASLGKYLEKLVRLQEEQFQKTGSVDTNKLINEIGAYSKFGGSGIFGTKDVNGENLMRLNEGIKSSFLNPKDELQKFYNTQSLIRADPTLQNDPYRLSLAVENPTIKQQSALLADTFNRSKGRGGGDFITTGDIQEVTGLTFTQSAEVAKLIQQSAATNGGVADYEKILTSVNASGTMLNNGKQLSEMTQERPFEKFDAMMQNALISTGEVIGGKLAEALGKMSGNATLESLQRVLNDILFETRKENSKIGMTEEKAREVLTKKVNSGRTPLGAPGQGAASGGSF